MSFAEQKAAAKIRDLIAKVSADTVSRLRPNDRFGVVTSINTAARTCMVRFPPADSQPVVVRYGTLQPSSIGQSVRVGVVSSEHWIVDVLGNSLLVGTPVGELGAPQNFIAGSITSDIRATWDAVEGAASYEIEFATNAEFIDARTYKTTNTYYILDHLSPGINYWVRVRALNSTEEAGPYSAVQAVQVTEFYIPPTDGAAPGNSPQPTANAGIGFATLAWLPLENPDDVTYEIHIGTVSGFAPNSTTYLGETPGTLYVVDHLPDGSQLNPDVVYYARIIAKDADGSAVPGAQIPFQTRKVELGDVGNVPSSELTDGAAPGSSPTPTVQGGIGYLYATWDHITNADQVTYEIHISPASGFTPSANTKVGETESTFAFVKKLGPGDGGTALVYGTTYYVRIWAKDTDGYAPSASAQISGAPVKVNTPDIAVGAITAASAIIADLAVGSAQIANAAITNAKIGSLAVDTGNIQDLAVTNAKINTLSVNKLTTGTLSAGITTSSYIRTASSGARVELDYNGVRIYNSSGSNTISLNTSGSGVFNGTITAGSTVTGALIRTASSGKRVELSPSYSSNSGGLIFYNSNGIAAGRLFVNSNNILQLGKIEQVATAVEVAGDYVGIHAPLGDITLYPAYRVNIDNLYYADIELIVRGRIETIKTGSNGGSVSVGRNLSAEELSLIHI